MVALITQRSVPVPSLLQIYLRRWLTHVELGSQVGGPRPRGLTQPLLVFREWLRLTSLISLQSVQSEIYRRLLRRQRLDALFEQPARDFLRIKANHRADTKRWNLSPFRPTQNSDSPHRATSQLVGRCADCGTAVCAECRFECCGDSFCVSCYDYHRTHACVRKPVQPEHYLPSSDRTG